MYNVFKYSYIKELELKHKNDFSLSKTNDVIVFPPVAKKIGINYHIVFPVVESPKEDYLKPIKRPVGLIAINLHNNKKTIYDLKEYEFCYKRNDFEIEIFDINSYKNLLPNINSKIEEKLKIALEQLQKVCSKISMFSKLNQEEYNLYLSKIQSLIPDNFWYFYQSLQENKIEKITPEIIAKRKKAKLEHQEKLVLIEKKLNEKKLKLKNDFILEAKNEVLKFLRQEVVPSLIGKGAYSKLFFYDLLGKAFKDFLIKTNEYSNCFDPKLPKEVLEENINEQIQIFKVKIIKLFSKATDNVCYKIQQIDTMSKLLIVMLNALMIQEKYKKILPSFEEEIAECKEILSKEVVNLTVIEAKTFLTKIFQDLNKDYLETKEENFSNIYFAYLKIFN